MRPIDLAREHGLSAQAVRNYEEAGALPEAGRTSSGYRRYTPRHRAALRAFLSLKQAIGHHPALAIMQAVHQDDLDGALEGVDRAHDQLLRDRATLAVVTQAAQGLGAAQDLGAAQSPWADGADGADRDDRTDRVDGAASGVSGRQGSARRVLSVGELAARIGVSPATLRHWEREGLLFPGRVSVGAHRLYGPQQVRDAELVHLLRRGGHGLGDIAIVLDQMRGGGGDSSLHDALSTSRERVAARGLALLRASSALASYIDLEEG